jgi:Ni,Fe-hydrogenase III small subunit
MSGGLGAFFIDCGGCGGCALEMRLARTALAKAGIDIVPTPHEADILLVAGPVTRAMAYALAAAWDAMAAPKHLVAVGDCAIDGGVFAGSYAVHDGLSAYAPGLVVRGCPPTPAATASALVTLTGTETLAPMLKGAQPHQ